MKKRQERNRRLSFILAACFVLPVLLLSNARAELVGLWHFNEGSGEVALNSSVYDGNSDAGLWELDDPDMSLDSNLPKWIDHTGYGKALEFGTLVPGVPPTTSDVNNWNYAYVPYRPELAQLGKRWTISCWVNQYTNDPLLNKQYDVNSSGYMRIISSPSYEIILGTPTDLNDYFWPNYADPCNAPFCFSMGQTHSLNEWYHMAITYDGTTFKKYINGNLVFTKTLLNQLLPSSVWDAGEYLRFGAQTTIEGFFVGGMDDVAIWSETLDNDEVNDVMAGNFDGPWEPRRTYETDLPITFMMDPSFIAQKGSIALDFGEKRTGAVGIPSWNWGMEGSDLNDVSFYGLVNAGLVDGDDNTIEYAGYTTIGSIIAQPKAGDYSSHWRILKDTKYDLKARFSGENAVGNVIGVRFYTVDVNHPENKTLIADLSQTIAESDHWYTVSTIFNASGAAYGDHNMVFRAECYIDQAGGNPRGSAFGWFDYVRADVNAFLTCEALKEYSNSHGADEQAACDFDEDCRINFNDFVVIADEWRRSWPEPCIFPGELLKNPDFYQDMHRVPNNLDVDAGPPTGWIFVPAITDTNAAGIENLDRNGLVNGTYQPAGGSVVAYMRAYTPEPCVPIILQQTITSETIVQDQNYYFTAMVSGGGSVSAYLGRLRAKLEYVTNPSDTTGTLLLEPNFICPESQVWRVISAVYKGTAASAGKYLRVSFDYGPNPISGGGNGYGFIGKASVTKTIPPIWPRANMLVNGNFEDYIALPMGTNTNDGWLDLYNYNGHWYEGDIPGWIADDGGGYRGLQCMLWAPPGQPAEGRTSAWLLKRIGQKVESEHIQHGQTYYVDFIGCINAGGYDTGAEAWPADANKDPNIVVNVYWLKDGVANPYGMNPPPGDNYGLITSLKTKLIGPLKGSTTYNVPWGDWAMPQISFVADTNGFSNRHFYVNAYEDRYAFGGPLGPRCAYATFEEVFLSKQPRLSVGAYTCYELYNKFGGRSVLETDLNDDCVIDLKDLDIFVGHWLECNDPAGCP